MKNEALFKSIMFILKIVGIYIGLYCVVNKEYIKEKIKNFSLKKIINKIKNRKRLVTYIIYLNEIEYKKFNSFFKAYTYYYKNMENEDFRKNAKLVARI